MTSPCGCKPDEGVCCEEGVGLWWAFLRAKRDAERGSLHAAKVIDARWEAHQAHIRRAREEIEEESREGD